MNLAEMKILALAKHLECSADEITETRHDTNTFDAPGGEYMVLTDEEADQKAADYIADSLWAFNASFILGECGLGLDLEEAIKTFQEQKCEGANDAIRGLIEKSCGLKSFVESVISADGRGHFLSNYDGEENEIRLDAVEGVTMEQLEEEGAPETLFVYRTN